MYVQAASEGGDGNARGGYRVSLMALKCINNAVWDQAAGQQSFVRLRGLDMVAKLLQVRCGLQRVGRSGVSRGRRWQVMCCVVTLFPPSPMVNVWRGLERNVSLLGQSHSDP